MTVSGGRTQSAPVHPVEFGKLTRGDVKEAEKIFENGKNQEKSCIDSQRNTRRSPVVQFSKGDRETFTEIYRANHPSVFRFALRKTGDRIKAGELAQDVFVWLIDHLRNFDPERGELGAYLIGVTRNFLLRQQRYAQRDAERWQPLMDSILSRPASHAPPCSVDAESVRKAIALLPVCYRGAVVLCDLEGKSYEDAATLLGCSVGTIRSRLHRGRKLLMRKLQPKTHGRRIEVEQRMAGHSNGNTTGLYDRRSDGVRVGEVERIGI